MMNCETKKVAGLAFIVIFFIFTAAVYAGEVVNPIEDREIIHNNVSGLTTILNDGQWWPSVKFDAAGNQEEGQVIVKYDLSAYHGLQFAQATVNFYVWKARNYETLSIDAMYYEGDGTISTADFNRGTDYVGTFTFDIPEGNEADYDVEQWVQYDVTDLINNRSGDYVYFNIRLSGGYPEFTGNVFADTDIHHLINIAAVENTSTLRPFFELTPPFVSAGTDRKVYDGRITLDGSQSYDPDSDIVTYEWSLKCRGNSAFDRIATGATAAISNLKPGFYDGTLTVTNGNDETATAGFVVFSGIGPQGDYNGDSDVDGADLAGFAAEFGN